VCEVTPTLEARMVGMGLLWKRLKKFGLKKRFEISRSPSIFGGVGVYV
jgi:hypothetical protein